MAELQRPVLFPFLQLVFRGRLVLFTSKLGRLMFEKRLAHFYTPELKFRTYYGMASVRPSIRLYIRPSVSNIMTAKLS